MFHSSDCHSSDVRMSLTGQAKKLMFGISLEETTFARRGFRAAAGPIQRRLEHIGATFLNGYHIGLDSTDLAELVTSQKLV